MEFLPGSTSMYIAWSFYNPQSFFPHQIPTSIEWYTFYAKFMVCGQFLKLISLERLYY